MTPSITDVARQRAAIARDQNTHWRKALFQPAKTKKELDRCERLWFWWGGIGWQAEMAVRGLWLQRERSVARVR
ncbi:MAG TPA: hypothetical protein VND96_06865 [Candidatus Micrarchaeaceae archaeon]|nr:hypothetical protein [Candidatus Micrarchaeaceae archaeon]